MSKSDLQTRPIFHYKEEPIKLHLLICFMALVLSKHIEFKTGISIRKFIDESKKIADGQIINHITKKTVTINAMVTPKMDELMKNLTALKRTSQENNVNLIFSNMLPYQPHKEIINKWTNKLKDNWLASTRFENVRLYILRCY